MSEFRPISCCSVLHEIISKVLASTLKVVLPDVINGAESAFVPGRYLGDNIMLAYDLVKHYERFGLSPICVLKIDIRMAYGSVELPFLKQVMLGLGFPTGFVD